MKTNNPICPYCRSNIPVMRTVGQKYCDYECQRGYTSVVGKIKNQLIRDLWLKDKDKIIKKAHNLAKKKIKEMIRNGDITSK